MKEREDCERLPKAIGGAPGCVLVQLHEGYLDFDDWKRILGRITSHIKLNAIHTDQGR